MEYENIADPKSPKLTKKLLNDSQHSAKNVENERFFEQYKLLIESTESLEESRNHSNTVFLTFNSIFVAFLLQAASFVDVNTLKAVFLSILLPIGVLVSCDWLAAIKSYKKINSVNYILIKAFELRLPTNIFSLRTELISSKLGTKDKANSIVNKEILLPIIFIIIYSLYFIIMMVLINKK